MEVQPQQQQQQHTHLWVANLTEDVSKKEIITLFEKYGPIHNSEMKGNFCRIEFENLSDALKAKRGLDGVDHNGRRLGVDWFRGYTFSKLEGLNWLNSRPGEPRYHNRIVVLNIPSNMIHTQLLELAWEGGSSVVFIDIVPWIFKDSKYGLIEYAHSDDYNYTLKYLDGKMYFGQRLRFIPAKKLDYVENYRINVLGLKAIKKRRKDRNKERERDYNKKKYRESHRDRDNHRDRDRDRNRDDNYYYNHRDSHRDKYRDIDGYNKNRDRDNYRDRKKRREYRDREYDRDRYYNNSFYNSQYSKHKSYINTNNDISTQKIYDNSCNISHANVSNNFYGKEYKYNNISNNIQNTQQQQQHNQFQQHSNNNNIYSNSNYNTIPPPYKQLPQHQSIQNTGGDNFDFNNLNHNNFNNNNNNNNMIPNKNLVLRN